MAVNGLASDARSIDSLKASATRDPKTAVREAAKQFEALFMQELMKSMRSAQATMASGMLDNAATKLGTEMLDTQFSTKMTGMPGGLADAIARQLERQMGAASSSLTMPKPERLELDANEAPRIPNKGAGAFVDQHQKAADAVSAESGIPAAFMIGQAAHESGWGRREIRNTDGSSSHNLFGIKAGSSWNGPTAEITTTEYIDGQARKVTARFRAYASYEESFRDYAKLIKDNPRYSDAAANTASASAYAASLQRAGYATDPAYADKLTRVINTTLRLQRANT